jgi:hypothetical protein
VVVVLTNALPYETWSKLFTYQSIYLLQADLAKGTTIIDEAVTSQ